MNNELSSGYYNLAIFWMSILFAFLFSVGMRSIYQQCCSNYRHKYSFKLSTADNYLNSIVICMCIISSGLDVTHVIIHSIEEHNFDSDIEPIIAGFADIIYFAAQLTFYTLLISNLYFVFNKSPIKISKYTLSFLIFLQILILINAIWHVNNTAFHKGSTDYSSKDTITIYSLSITDFILNIFLFFLFSYKIRRLILLQKTYKNSNNNTDFSVNNDNNNLNIRLRPDPAAKLFQLISKHSVLFGIALITNQFFYGGIILEELLRVDHENYTEALLIALGARSIENFINGIVVWLMLPENNKFYIYWCHSCHNCTQKCCKCITPRKETETETMSEYVQNKTAYDVLTESLNTRKNTRKKLTATVNVTSLHSDYISESVDVDE